MLTLAGIALDNILTPIDLALIYLMGVVFIAARFSRGAALLYSALSVSCFNFFFVPPIYTFNVYDRSYWLTFIVMLVTGFVIANQSSLLRRQAVSAHKREQDTQAFYALTRALTSTRDRQEIIRVGTTHIDTMFQVKSLIGLPDTSGQVQIISGTLPLDNTAKETAVLQWCYDHNQISGRNTVAMPSAAGLYFPLTSNAETLGVLCALPQDSTSAFSDRNISLLETCSRLIASALERVKIAEIAEKSRVEAESEKLRTMLLSSVSHDLRTPLASITGASSTIVNDIAQLPRETIHDLASSINKEAVRLSRLVTNLLEVTRLESGAVRLNTQPYFIEELIGSALAHLEPILSKHIVLPHSEEELPLVLADGVMIEQVLINLLENAVYYTPEGSTLRISAKRQNLEVIISITDNGPGIPSGHEVKIFDKFYSIPHFKRQKGTGLGLAICASIIKAHKGEIWAKNTPDGGACFYFTLPIVEHQKQGLSHAIHK